MKYTDKVLKYITEEIKPGNRVEVAKIATYPEIFINTIKELFDQGYINMNEFEFNSDYTYLKRLGND